ncbi:ATP-grasp domain-containing protein [Acidithiobacillus concretivorus]|uniref:RimK family alpha-L-glutamate ligase n=1 Tax=Acidithiobacillus concretivorus TaxID=3063952 RepID=A0ABS5ZNV4_9PROT|nr:RimK family alpha-L-glutamate ligase [Acidithiobacillus concretivorus]MBU2737837.1 RimK family alpha-L-glutamate ligase [Acidithiobacillus concretivorus]
MSETPRIAVLSRFPGLYSTQKLLQVVEAAGMEAVLLAPEQCLLTVNGVHADLYVQGEKFPHCAAVIPRIGGPITALGARLLRYFAGKGTFCLNSAGALQLARDKFASLQALAAAGIAVPQTVYFTESRQKELALQMLGTPLVHKLLQGSQGVGVSLAETPVAARGMLDTFLSLQHEAMVQRFLPGRQDVRVIVLFGEVVAAMRRESAAEDFRSNLHCGGRALAFPDLPDSWAEIARKAAVALGLDFAGVDLMADADQNALVLEVNPVPSLEGIEKSSGVDVAGRIIAALKLRLASA